MKIKRSFITRARLPRRNRYSVGRPPRLGVPDIKLITPRQAIIPPRHRDSRKMAGRIVAYSRWLRAGMSFWAAAAVQLPTARPWTGFLPVLGHRHNISYESHVYQLPRFMVILWCFCFMGVLPVCASLERRNFLVDEDVAIPFRSR